MLHSVTQKASQSLTKFRLPNNTEAGLRPRFFPTGEFL
jgi:hypothetical protein